MPPSDRHVATGGNFRPSRSVSADGLLQSTIQPGVASIAANRQPGILSSTPAVRPGAVGRADSVRIVSQVSVLQLSSGSAFRDRFEIVVSLSG